MRVGFVADVHANAQAFEAVLAHLGRLDRKAVGPCSCGADVCSVDRIYHVGDLVGYSADPQEVVEFAREHTEGGVLGNHDWAALREGYVPFNPSAYAGLEHSRRVLEDDAKAYLARLPLRVDVRIAAMDVTLVHGSPADPLWEYVFPESAPRVLEAFLASPHEDAPCALVLGHTHVPVARAVAPPLSAKVATQNLVRLASGKSLAYAAALFNPGSVGQPRDGDPRAAVLVLDTETGAYAHHRVPYDVSSAARRIRDVGLPTELGERLFHGR